eukprot:1190528-Prorocentrum_minimum.AAC.2
MRTGACKFEAGCKFHHPDTVTPAMVAMTAAAAPPVAVGSTEAAELTAAAVVAAPPVAVGSSDPSHAAAPAEAGAQGAVLPAPQPAAVATA